jgi:hypothetical protein
MWPKTHGNSTNRHAATDWLTDWHAILQFYHCHNCELVGSHRVKSEWWICIYITLLHLINCACMRFHILTAVAIVITAFWNLSPCSLAERYHTNICRNLHPTLNREVLCSLKCWHPQPNYNKLHPAIEFNLNHACPRSFLTHTLWKRQTTKQASTVVLDTQQQP